MAASKPRQPKASAPSPKPIVANEADPQSWLYLNPAGPSPSGLVFAVLRKSYAGRTNRSLEFGWRKCHVGHNIAEADVRAWSPNVERVEVILPPDAEDSLSDPATLLARMDACAIDREKALLIYLTLPLGDVDRVHAGWERARSFACRLARDRGLASVVSLHAPGRIAAPFPLHAHCMLMARRADATGGLAYGLYDEELIRDSGQAVIEALWAEHLASFR